MHNKARKLIFVLALLLGQITFADTLPDVKAGPVMISAKTLENLIKQREGRVLFLNVWATWCKPCVEEFPEIVRLHNQYGGKGLEVVTISVDFPEDSLKKVEPFLRKSGAAFKNYIAIEKEAEKIINLLNKEWSGAIPATFIFDVSGKMIYYTIGTFKYEVISGKIESLIKK